MRSAVVENAKREKVVARVTLTVQMDSLVQQLAIGEKANAVPVLSLEAESNRQARLLDLNPDLLGKSVVSIARRQQRANSGWSMLTANAS